MTFWLDMRLFVTAVLVSACAQALDPTPAPAQELEAAACLAFEGDGDCRTVTIIDAEACVVKIRLTPLPELDPAVSGCLIDEIGTRQLYLKNAEAVEVAVSDGSDAVGGAAKPTRVRIEGPKIVRVLTAYDEAGAPVWEARDAVTFEHEGKAAATRTAIEALSPERCSLATQTTRATPRAIGVEEAYRLSAAGRILLIDVRLESDWRETGIAATAVPITLNQRAEDFIRQLGAAADDAGGTPIALICTRGVRTAWLQRVLKDYGFEGIIDVKGGMLGGDGAPGWIAVGLPVKPYEEAER
ncbi:MAG: rhodanese-like domain-containing protein [Rhodospirillales bacterium]|nr:MAG: rhodanese-like domain-containing protein [Rhodospirillales bacterium]